MQESWVPPNTGDFGEKRRQTLLAGQAVPASNPDSDKIPVFGLRI